MIRDRKFYKSLLALALPIVLQNVITFCVNMADNVMIGSLGDSAVSGVYMGNQVQTVLQVCCMGIESALILLSGQYWGKRDTISARKVISTAMTFTLSICLILTVVCSLFPAQVLGIFTREQGVIESGVEYLKIVCLSYMFFALTQGFIASMRSVESTKVGMFVSACSLVVNICLNYILIFGKLGFAPMGIRGAAIATLIARIVEAAIMFVYVYFVDKKLHFRLSGLLHPDKAILKDFIRYGAPLVAGQLVWGSNLIANSMILGRFSESVIAATSVTNTMNSMLYMCLTGLSAAVGITTSKKVGAGDVGDIKIYSRTVQILFVLMGLFTFGMLQLVRDPFISMFAISEDAMVYARQFITVLSFTAIGTCYESGCHQGLVKSGGDVSFVFKNDTIFVYGVIIPSGIITSLLGCPPWVVFLCLRSDQILKCAVAFFKVRKYNWIKNLTR